MALKILIIFFSMIQLSFGQDDKTLFGRAKVLAEKGKNKQALEVLEKRYSLASPKTPLPILELAGIIAEKVHASAKGLKINLALINSRFARQYRTAKAHYIKEGSNDDFPEFPERYGLYFERIGKIYSDQYFKSGKNYQLAKMHLEFASELDREVDSILTEIENYRQKEAMGEIHRHFFLSLAWSSWRESLTEVSSLGEESKVFATTRGLALGGGVSWANFWSEYYAQSLLTFSEATVESSSYTQDKVAVNGFFLTGGALYRPSENIGIGAELGVIYRVGDFTERSGFTLNGKSRYGAIAHAVIKLQEGHWAFVSKLGGSTALKGSSWQVGVDYYF